MFRDLVVDLKEFAVDLRVAVLVFQPLEAQLGVLLFVLRWEFHEAHAARHHHGFVLLFLPASSAESKRRGLLTASRFSTYRRGPLECSSAYLRAPANESRTNSRYQCNFAHLTEQIIYN